MSTSPLRQAPLSSPAPAARTGLGASLGAGDEAVPAAGPAPGPAPGPDPDPASRERVIGSGVTWLSRWTLRWLVVALGASLIAWGVERFWSILLPVVLALILATVLEPPARWLERRWRLPAPVAAVAVVLAGVAGVVLAAVLLAPGVGSQAVDLADSASAGLGEVEQAVRDSPLDVTEDQVETAVDALQDRLTGSAGDIASGVLLGVSAITSALITVVLTLVLAFLFIKDGRRFLPWLGRLAGPVAGGHLTEVGRRSWATLGGFIRTQALVGTIDAVLIGLALVVIGVPLAAPLAVLTFVAAFAPIVGAFAVGGLAVLVALVAQGWGAAIAVLVVVVVVQQLEGNVLLPWLQGRSLRLHAGVVLLAIVLGSTLFGVAGAFLSVPAVAVGAVVLRYLDEQVSHRVEAPAEASPVPEPGASGDPS